MSFDVRSNRMMTVAEGQVAEVLADALRRVYLWMMMGLLITSIVSAVVIYTPLLLVLVSNSLLFYGLLLGELVLVIAVSAAINRLSPATALLLFFAYSALNGATMALIFLTYTAASIALTFFATASLFGAMSIIGYTTRLDLSRAGSFLLMGLIGLIIASVVNLFLASTALEWIITYFGILLFLGLTVYDTQRIKQYTIAAIASGHDQAVAVGRIGVLGALRLYLDFINLFLLLLRVMGRRR